MRESSLLKVIMPIINPLYPLQIVIQAPLRHMTGHAFRSREAAEGAAQIVNGEMLKAAHLVRWLLLAAGFPPEQL